MSRRPSFANLRGSTTPSTTPAPAAPPAAAKLTAPAARTAASETSEGRGGATTRAVSREGRKQIAGFFTPEMSLALHMLALRQGRSLQALMAEAFNDVLRKHGESPIGD